MKKVQLSGKKGQGLSALVDDSHFAALNKHKWHCESSGGYAVRHVREEGKVRRISMHRLLMGEPAGMEVDHRNGDRLDNRLNNLRICTKAENRRNRIATAKSGYKGVSLEKGRWRASIRVGGKTLHLGSFPSAKEAAAAYNQAALREFGDFAWLNTLQAPLSQKI
jgi:hypothetical protein